MVPIRRLIGLYCFCFLLLPVVLHAEVIGYMKIDGIDGEVTATGYEGHIAILGFGHSVSRPSYTGDGPIGDADFQDIRVIKAINSTSPLLSLMVAKGDVISEVTLYFTRDEGPEKWCYYKIELTESVVITGLVPSIGAAAGTEMVSFSFGRIRWVAKKTPGDPDIVGEWDVFNNAPLL